MPSTSKLSPARKIWSLLTSAEHRRVAALFGNFSQQSMVVGGMLALVEVYLIKAPFLALFAWQQTRFAFGIQVRLSRRLFTVYLRQSYMFHLQRNAAQFIMGAYQLSFPA